MAQYKKIGIHRNENGTIEAYSLMGTDKKVHTVPKDKLKELIRSGQVTVVNLTLSSDNRLVEKEYKPDASTTEAEKRLLHELTERLNQYRDSYYNHGTSLVSDGIYDRMFDKLAALEKKLGIALPNSPTQTVGYEVKTGFEKVRLDHPMRSLDKTKDPNALLPFTSKPCLLMYKMDGLSLTLRYSGKDGKLKSAVTRGNGEFGEDVTRNAKYFKLPLQINYKGDKDFIIDGEAIITFLDFELANSGITNPDEKYKTARNLAAGTVRHSNPSVIMSRNVRFVGWKVVSGIDTDSFSERLLIANHKYGFKMVPFFQVAPNCSADQMVQYINALRDLAKRGGYPIDGLVISYDSVSYGDSLGATSHHVRSQLAFKFQDEEEETTLRDVIWSMGKTGTLTPVAVFDTVLLDGTEVNKASVHNLSVLRGLKLGIGDKIVVYKANQIIPQIRRNLTQSDSVKPPTVCPVCGAKTNIITMNDTTSVVCSNPNCHGKLLGTLSYFVGNRGMNIVGLSDSTLSKFIQLGWVKRLSDIYDLKSHRDELAHMEGFGEKSVDKLLESIETSKTVTLNNFITALSIPLVGRSAGKALAKELDYDIDAFINALRNKRSFQHLDDFGEAVDNSLHAWATADNIAEVEHFRSILHFEKPVVKQATNSSVKGKSFVITGSLNGYPNRDALKDKLESLGAKVSGSVTSKTDYLINNDINSTSGKNKKAKELGVPIISESQLEQML